MNNIFTYENIKNNVSINLSTDEKLKDDSLKLPEIEDFVKRFNKVNNDLILDYDYCLNDEDDSVDLCILFKHCLSKFGVTQKYINYNIKKDKNNIICTKISSKPHIKIPSNVDCMNIANLKVSYKIVDDIKSASVNYNITNMSEDFKYYNMIESLLKIVFVNFMKEFGQELLSYIHNNNITNC